MLEIDWKTRAIERRIENKKLKKKCKELTISHDGWKEKAIKRKADVNVLNKQLSVVKKNIQKIEKLGQHEEMRYGKIKNSVFLL